MANFDNVDAPRQLRRRKSARERREQRARALTRAFETVASALDNVRLHRGGALRDIGTRWHSHILRPHAKDVPCPNFDLWGTHCKVVLHSSNGSEDAASHLSSGDHSMQDPDPVQEEDQESEELASRDDDDEESASRSSIGSEGAHGNVALSHESGCDASDREPEVAVGMQRRIVEDDPEAQRLFQTIYLPGFPHPEDEVGGNDLSCTFSTGDLIRPRFCLAELEAYERGAVAQVMSIGEGSIRDIAVSFFDDEGNRKERQKLYYSEHFVKIGTASMFDEQSRIPRSTLLKDRGALLKACTDVISGLSNRAFSSAESSRGRTAK